MKTGGMENWGLVTYNQHYVIYLNQLESTVSDQDDTAELVAHEVAHQWFGNLVTMSWWDDIWLKEGFATFMSFFSLDLLHPEWQVFDKFILHCVEGAFQMDEGYNFDTQAVISEVSRASETFERGPVVFYDKAAALIRMMRHFIGYDNFKSGMELYLKKNMFGSVSHSDLFDCLSTETPSNLDLAGIMDTWLKQAQYPIVTLTRDENNPFRLNITQIPWFNITKYTFDPDESAFNYSWTIPLTFATEKQPIFDETKVDIYWMNYKENDKSFDLDDMISSNKSEWILGNVGQLGYYRVNYERSNWEALARQLRVDHRVIPSVNRAQIIRDAWFFFDKGALDLDIALLTLDYLDNETEYLPLLKGLKRLKYLDSYVKLTELETPVKKLVREKLRNIYRHFRLLDTASHPESRTRAIVAEDACDYDVTQCLDDSVSAFELLIDSPNSRLVDPDVKHVVVCNALRQDGDNNKWQYAVEMYRNIKCLKQKKRFLAKAMSCFTSEDVHVFINENLYEQLEFGEDNFREFFWLLNESGNWKALFTNFIQENKDYILGKYESLAEAIGWIMGDELEEDPLSTDRPTNRWVEKHGKTLDKYLRDRGYMT